MQYLGELLWVLLERKRFITNDNLGQVKLHFVVLAGRRLRDLVLERCVCVCVLYFES